MRVCNVKSYNQVLTLFKLWRDHHPYKNAEPVSITLPDGRVVVCTPGGVTQGTPVAIAITDEEGTKTIRFGPRPTSVKIILTGGGVVEGIQKWYSFGMTDKHNISKEGHNLSNYFHNFLEPTEEEQMMFSMQMGGEWVFTKSTINMILRCLYTHRREEEKYL